MASTAPTSDMPSSSSTSEVRRQADELPRKRGEIGFREISQQAQEVQAGVVTPQAGTDVEQGHREDSASPPVASTTQGASSPPSVASSTHKARRQKLLSLFREPTKHWKVPKVAGIYVTSLLRFFIQISFIGGTIAAWVIITRHISDAPPSSQTSDELANSDDSSAPFAGNTSAIFVHVAFAVMTLAQILFLERIMFQLRAQRYCYLHPNSVLPTTARRGAAGIPVMGFAPWNRPPLPTYAAALAQSGYGTGDVEDNVIAIPPPPAYGNTRGSTLLLASFLRNSLLRQTTSRESTELSSREPQPGERPMSYMTRDEAWEERCDAERARRLEESLTRLETRSSLERSAR